MIKPRKKLRTSTKRVMETNISLKAGTASGTVLSILPNILSEDIVKTIILAALGATVSFTVSLLLKWLTKSKNKQSSFRVVTFTGLTKEAQSLDQAFFIYCNSGIKLLSAYRLLGLCFREIAFPFVPEALVLQYALHVARALPS